MKGPDSEASGPSDPDEGGPRPPLEIVCRDLLVAGGRRQWLENSGCAARGSFVSGGFRLDQGGRVLLAQGSLSLENSSEAVRSDSRLGAESPDAGEAAVAREGSRSSKDLGLGVAPLLGALSLELRARGAEPVAVMESLRLNAELVGSAVIADRCEQLRCEVNAAAEQFGVAVSAGECGRSLSERDALFLVVVGVLPRVPRRDRESHGSSGDRVYRVAFPEASSVDFQEQVLGVGHALRDAYQGELLSWVGSCRDGGLLAAADWLETTGMGLRFNVSGSDLASLTDPCPEAFLVAGLGDADPVALLPDTVTVTEVGSITTERQLDLDTADGPTLRLRPEEIRRDQQPPEFPVSDMDRWMPPPMGEELEDNLFALIPDFRNRAPRGRMRDDPPRAGPQGLSGDVAVLRLGARRDLLALAVGSAQGFSSADPYIGACLGVCRVTRSLAAAGAETLGLLVSLPGEKVAGANLVYEGLRHAADGLGTTIEMATASAGASAVPVVVALGRPVATKLVPSVFQRAGDLAVVLGRTREELAGSLYDARVRGTCHGTPPWMDLGAERRLQEFVRTAAESNLLQSALSLTSGGLGRALLEACGVDEPAGRLLGLVAEADETLRPEAWLFAESPSRLLVSVAPDDLVLLRERAERLDVPLHFLGEIGEDRIEIRGQFGVALESLRRSWHGSTVRAD